MKRLFPILRIFGNRPLRYACLFLVTAAILLSNWDDVLSFTDGHPLLRLLLSAEWAIVRYCRGATLFDLSFPQFFWVLIAFQVLAWLFWVVVFSRVSPWIAKRQKTRSVLSYLTLKHHEKHLLAQRLTGLIHWAMRHKRAGQFIANVFFFAFASVSHGDIPAIAVATGFRKWGALGIILAAMILKIVFWSNRSMGYPF